MSEASVLNNGAVKPRLKLPLTKVLSICVTPRGVSKKT